MKALSIWQPHASLAAGGLKPYETRSWPAPKYLIGQRIAIHAAKAQSDLVELAEYYRDWRSGEADGNDPWFDYIKAIASLGFDSLADLPRGAVVGTAILDASIPTEQLQDPGPFGNFAPGRYAWRLTEAIALAEPVLFRGQQGIFEIPDCLVTLGSG